ncbi:MAG TPA: hypothetical protein VKY56_06090 [Chloroflexota bacterium]|nr:hypothetical protein [Chloroflexota bacterium]
MRPYSFALLRGEIVVQVLREQVMNVLPIIEKDVLIHGSYLPG